MENLIKRFAHWLFLRTHASNIRTLEHTISWRESSYSAYDRGVGIGMLATLLELELIDE